MKWNFVRDLVYWIEWMHGIQTSHYPYSVFLVSRILVVKNHDYHQSKFIQALNDFFSVEGPSIISATGFDDSPLKGRQIRRWRTCCRLRQWTWAVWRRKPVWDCWTSRDMESCTALPRLHRHNTGRWLECKSCQFNTEWQLEFSLLLFLKQWFFSNFFQPFHHVRNLNVGNFWAWQE